MTPAQAQYGHALPYTGAPVWELLLVGAIVFLVGLLVMAWRVSE